MKRKSAFICPVLLMAMAILLVAIAIGPCGAATDSSIIRVGSELEFAPYAFVDENGQPAGFSVDLIRAVAGAMSLSIHISSGTWDSVWNDLTEGRLDALPIVAKLSERTPLVDFSLPHTETYDSFFVRRGDPVIKNIEGAIGKEIVVMRSDAAHHALMERNFQGRMIFVDTIPDGLSLISSGKHDAFLCSKLIGVLAIEKHKLEGLAYGPTIQDYKRVFSFAVKKGDAELLEKLNQGLLIIKASGEYQQIYNKWLRVDDPWRKFEKYLIPIILVVTAVVMIGGFWLFMLKRLVSKRTRELAEKNELLRQATEGLEATVSERTAELINANAMLKDEITERKQAEDELNDAKKEIEKWNKELERRVEVKTEELVKSQNLLIQAEKLSAMGQMAGGLAHELNSPLAGLVPMLEIHRKRAKEGSSEHNELTLMIKAADHMAKIIKDFGLFSRESKSEFRTLSLNEVIEDTLSFSAVRLKQKGIKVKEDLSARLPLIHGEKTELQQVVLNMITNARDAMNEGGKLNIKTDVSEDKSKVTMEFIDDGAGINKENLNRIFDPFFTTKKEGEGTGLGLSVSYGLIKKHNGVITVESKPGQGTKFLISLPAIKSPRIKN
jgi:polar amino acid transport system substrate-binding protein